MEDLFVAISVVIVSCSFLAWLACRGHQPIILAYFVCGVLMGPSGLGLIHDVHVLDDMSHIGVTLLLFMAGLVLHPDRLRTFFKTAATVTLAGSALSVVIVFALLRVFGYGGRDSLIAAIALMFSSTILVVKLLPTTTLHQKKMGSICIAVLIAQDLLAVIALLFVGSATMPLMTLLWLPLKLLLLIALTIPTEQIVLRRMMRRVDRYNEVMLMLCLGWGLGIALLAKHMGIPYEVGAFLAGIAIARGKIALVFSEELKPLRDFFLMFFFFVLGAGFRVSMIESIWLPTLVLTIAIVVSRPLWLRWLFRRLGEEKAFATETGLRLGQASEFALIIAVAALASGRLSNDVAQMIQLTTVLTMLASSYIVVFKCPTPLGVRARLKRD